MVAQRCLAAVAGSVTALCASVGHSLGLYSTLARLGGPASPGQLANAAGGLSERYVAEWCCQQAAAGLISTDRDAARFWLSAGQAAVLTEPDQPAHAQETPLGACRAVLRCALHTCM